MRITTLKLNKEFKHAYYQGKFRAHPYLITYLVKNKVSTPRVGITTGKKVGGAVARNRARRIIKCAYRELLNEGTLNVLIPFKKHGYDVVFVAREQTSTKKMQEIKTVMKKQLELLS